MNEGNPTAASADLTAIEPEPNGTAPEPATEPAPAPEPAAEPAPELAAGVATDPAAEPAPAPTDPGAEPMAETAPISWQPSTELYRAPYPAEWMKPQKFISARRMSIVAVAMLAVAGCLGIALAVHFITGLGMIAGMGKGSVTLTELNSFDDLTRNLSLLQFAVTIVSGVAFMRWEWRLARNAVEMGASYGIVDPRGAVTAWLVPIRNLWKPYQVMRDLHDRLLHPLTSSTGRWLLRLWWLLWLLGDVLGWALAWFIHPKTLQSMAALWAGMAVSGALLAADAVLAIAVVLQLQRLGNAREVNNQGNPAAAIEMIERSQRRRVSLAPFLLALAIAVAFSVPGVAAYPGAANVGSSNGTWQTVTALDGSFRVDFPANPIVVPIPANAANQTAGGQSAKASLGTTSYIVTEYSYDPGLLALVDRDSTYQVITSNLRQMGVRISSQQDVAIGGLAAIEVEGSVGGTSVVVRFCVSGDRVFAVEVDSTGLTNSADRARFFDSFAILK